LLSDGTIAVCILMLFMALGSDPCMHLEMKR
jgi:hypothetical protein